MATNDEIIKGLYSAFSAYLLSVNPTIQEGSSEYLAITNWSDSFSKSIGGAIVGGSSGIIPTDFLQKAGDNMIGLLKSNYGFEAGATNGTPLFKVYLKDKTPTIDFLSDVNILNSSIIIDGNNFLKTSIDSFVVGEGATLKNIDFSNLSLSGISSATIGSSISNITINDSGIFLNGNEYYNQSNANLETVSWKTLDLLTSGNATIDGYLNVAGESILNGSFSFGLNGPTYALSYGKGLDISVNENLSISDGKSILFGESIITTGLNQNLFINSKGNLLLQSGAKSSIRLMSSLANENGDLEVIDKFGSANFIRGASLGVGDEVTLQTVSYGGAQTDKGIEVLNFINFKNTNSGLFSFLNGNIGLVFGSSSINISKDGLLVGLDIVSDNQNDKFFFKKDVLSVSRFSIYNSSSNATPTYLGDKILYLGDNGDSSNLIGHYFLNSNAGIRVNGDIINNNFAIRSEDFSEGFSGTGTRVDFYKNEITTDFLVVRRKLRVYEFEIVKISSTNGNLFVTASTSGDYVQEIL